MKSSWICCGLFRKKSQEKSHETEIHISLVTPQPEVLNAQAPYKIPEPRDIQNIELPAFKSEIR